ncbi:AIPR family protein [Falsiroseomonas oryzae]|uniref:AIPR family protein n=1 Tax=Falsiroseomonas oryzae TaxID=2766473 RepID=UPI0022EA9EE2|nr:AIPR family protein [Roseomonas sp. MO-31]
MTVEDFLKQLQTDIRERMAEGDAPPYSEMVFAELVMDHMAEIGMTSDPVVCHYAARVDRAELRLSGYAVSRDDEQLDLFVSLYDGMETVAPVPDSETTQAAGRCLAFLAKCAEGRLASRIDEANEAHELAQIIEMIFPKLDHITIHVLTDRVAKSKSFKSREVNGKTVRLEVMDIERLYRHLSEGKPRDEMVFDFKSLSGAPLPCVLIPGQETVYSVALAALPGEALRVTYEKFGARLLEANVRSFLSSTNKVNRGIRDTLRTSPEHFMAFNNGVVMIADEAGYEATADGGPGIAWLRGVQIVNGGQTTASIYFTKKKAADTDLRSVRVPAKIIILGAGGEDGEAAREALVSNVSRFANSQSAVKVSDLSANRPFHRQLEQLSQSTFCPDGTTRWFYERAAGSYNVMLARKGDTASRLKKLKAEFPPAKKFNKTELAKCLMTWAGFPQVASFGLQKNFERFSQLLDEEEGAARWPISNASDYKRIVAQVIVFRTVQKLVRPLVTAFQANVTVYTVALMSERLRAHIDLDRVWTEQAMTPQAVAVATTWAKQVDEALQASSAGRMVSEWAKKQDCWEYVRSLNLPDQPTA